MLGVGFSFGADVASFLVNQLLPQRKSRVAAVTPLGPSETAPFEFHLASSLGGAADARYPTVPEISRLSVPFACILRQTSPIPSARRLRCRVFVHSRSGRGTILAVRTAAFVSRSSDEYRRSERVPAVVADVP